ncbi:MAG: PRC-barrel domain-containing protein [Pseudanabaenaceae cyanobacterium]
MQSDNYCQRSSVLGTQVISQATAVRLGIVTQLWLDVDQRRVMGFTIAERYIPRTTIAIGDTFYMSLDRIALLGPDAILVDNESVLEDIITSERYTNLIGCEVITESGEPLGKVRDFKFERRSGALQHLIIASLANPIIPDTLISTYEIDVNEIIAVGRDRIIVTEGMEERMTQLTRGLLERIGLGKPPWEDDFEDIEMPVTNFRDNNALPTGQKFNPTPRTTYRRPDTWDDADNWAQERTPPARRQARAEPPRVEPRPEPKPFVPPPPIEDEDYEEELNYAPKEKPKRRALDEDDDM